MVNKVHVMEQDKVKNQNRYRAKIGKSSVSVQMYWILSVVSFNKSSNGANFISPSEGNFEINVK